MRKGLKLLGILGAIILTAVFAAWMLERLSPPPAFATLPNPNGYDLFLKAGELIQGEVPDDTNQLSRFVSEQNEALRLFEKGMTTDSEANLLSAPGLPKFGNLKRMAQVLSAKARLAKIEGHPEQAAEQALQIIRYGQKIEHGPLICLLVGLAVERIGLDLVEETAPDLSSSRKEEAAQEILALNETRITLENVWQRELHYMRSQTSNFLRIIIGRFQIRSAFAIAGQKEDQLAKSFEAAAQQMTAPTLP